MVRPQYTSGFTVIEVMLFFAISGLMITGMFVGISGSINRQRYDDAVHSLQDYMQGQYNFVDNVRNNRISASVAGCDGAARGTSTACMIVGRLITTTNGSTFTSEPVFSTNPTLDTTNGETALLNSLGLALAASADANDKETYQTAWSTRIYTNKNDPSASRTAQLLILRMPTSDVVRTYFRTATTGPLSGFWAGAPVGQLALCVEPDGLIGSSPTGVRILANAINANSVQFITAGANVC